MEIRSGTPADLTGIVDIDATIESTEYLHVEHEGEGLAMSWRIEPRPTREKSIVANPLGDDRTFTFRQIASGIEEGMCLVAEHDDMLVALLLAQADAAHRTMRILDIRVDYDMRRQGLATAMLYSVINQARDQELRAVTAETTANNIPAARLLARCGFEICGIDQKRHTNHDLVKEAVTLFWYAALD